MEILSFQDWWKAFCTDLSPDSIQKSADFHARLFLSVFISLTPQLFFYMSRPDWTCMCVVDLMMTF